MNQPIYVAAHHCISPLGFTSKDNFKQVFEGQSGITEQLNSSLLPNPFFAAKINEDQLNQYFTKLGEVSNYTVLERMMLIALQGVIEASGVDITAKTGLIISTTKGNIDVLSTKSKFDKQRAYLPVLAKVIQDFFGFQHQGIVVSNACVSGILSMAIAKRLIQQGVYENAFVVSGDLLSAFVLSGFASFQALCEGHCQPFSANRKGINLGEAAAAVFITKHAHECNERAIKIIGDGSCNDANHISGPSRTGEGLVQSMQQAFKEAGIGAQEIDYVSAHGTATLYNDEMEAIALDRMGLVDVPVNSLKGYYGHTLGTAGMIEAIIGFEALTQNQLIASKGFDELGVSKPINVIKENQQVPLHRFLKTASGFGGCNTAVLFEKLVG
ncbi:beta-ketoacyl synthase [Flavobacteriaceae bacterium F08102]|nr:beta-ketoacyl synthase [Flavobacteriaceae bacterium F08102]